MGLTTMRTRGFTLVELVVVIMITGIMAASLTVFFVPAMNTYFDSRRRAEMTDTADTALRRMTRDVRRAVPNSIRSISGTCFQLVPSVSGGLYRRAADINNAGEDSLDIVTADSSFDVLSPLTTSPTKGDFVVIGNQNTVDVYSGATRATVDAWAAATTPAEQATRASRITLTSAKQFPASYDGGRFQVVAATEPSVTYVCDLANHVLLRVVGTDFSAPGTCPAGGDLLASNVSACDFAYDPVHGATQQSGFVWMYIALTAGGETMALSSGTHVSNVP
jgi:MSHA biogenesis protein MshO